MQFIRKSKLVAGLEFVQEPLLVCMYMYLLYSFYIDNCFVSISRISPDFIVFRSCERKFLKKDAEFKMLWNVKGIDINTEPKRRNSKIVYSYQLCGISRKNLPFSRMSSILHHNSPIKLWNIVKWLVGTESGPLRWKSNAQKIDPKRRLSYAAFGDCL